MDSFYSYNFKAVFLGDGKESFKKVCSLYSKYGIESVVLDEKPRFITRLCTFIKTISIAGIKEDEFLLDMLDSLIEKNENLTYLMFVSSEKFKGFIERNKDLLHSRFIMCPELILNDLQ